MHHGWFCSASADFSVQTIAAKTPRKNSEIFMANSPPLENPIPHILFPALHSLSDEDARQATADRALFREASEPTPLRTFEKNLENHKRHGLEVKLIHF
jgi:hypothetical protein